MTAKEMTENGRVRRLGHVLESIIHVSFTNQADMLFEQGYLSREERILLSNRIGDALQTFGEGIPEELGMRNLDDPPAWLVQDLQQEIAEEMMSQMDFKDGVKEKLLRLIGVKKEEVQPKTSFVLHKGKDHWWVLGIYSNKFLDRDTEIIPFDAHKEYAEWVTETGFKPVVTVYHQPQMPPTFWHTMFEKYIGNIPFLNEVVKSVYKDYGIAEVERIIPLNGFVAYVGKVFADKHDIVEKLAEEEDLAMSHGFILLDKSDNILAKYRSFELTYLKRGRAANLFTSALMAFRGEKQMVAEKKLSDEDREFMARVFGPEVAADIENGTEKATERLESILAFKSQLKEENSAEPEEAVVEEKVPELDEGDEDPMVENEEKEVMEEKQVAEQPLDEKVAQEVQEEVKTTTSGPALSYEAIRDQLIADLNLKGLMEVINTLTQENESLKGQIAEVKGETAQLKVSEDEKIAAQFQPFYWGGIGHRAASSDKNLLTPEEAEKLEASGPVGINPLDPNSPMDVMFHGALGVKK